MERPRVRGLDGKELPLPSWERAVEEDWLGRWAMNLMLINVSTRKFRRAVRLPEGDVPAPAGSGVSKSAASRHFVALSAARMQVWMTSDLSKLVSHPFCFPRLGVFHHVGRTTKVESRPKLAGRG